ncbi:MAG: D-alanine-D-alanine ligase [Lentimonas sp.]|jgi:D-alanine-D-alanine ligase
MKKIAIFCGGYSSEFDISMKSADTILNALPKDYDSFLVVVTKKGWTVDYKGVESPINMNDLSFVHKGEIQKIDIGLVYIHGNPGENGKIQAFLEMKGLPCVNSGALASELSFDKWYCNQFLRGFDINVAKSIRLTLNSSYDSRKIIDQLGLPIFVKPCDSGSSFGISKVKELSELKGAIIAAQKEGESIVLESMLNGTEVTCGVYRAGGGIIALPLTEIVSHGDFFDYDAKYLGKSEEITPARVSEEITKKVQEVSKKAYSLLNLRSISRIDFMIVDGEPFIIEVNTTPGFSAASIVPKMLSVASISIPDFWSSILKEELPQ